MSILPPSTHKHNVRWVNSFLVVAGLAYLGNRQTVNLMYVVLTSTNLGFDRVLEQLLLLVSRGTWVFLYGVITEKSCVPSKIFL
jgi:hypothetical protein